MHKVAVYWFSEQLYTHVTDADLEPYNSGRLGFLNTYFDPAKANVLYNQYHKQSALADEAYVQGPLGIARLFFWIARPSSIREGSPKA